MRPDRVYKIVSAQVLEEDVILETNESVRSREYVSVLAKVYWREAAASVLNAVIVSMCGEKRRPRLCKLLSGRCAARGAEN